MKAIAISSFLAAVAAAPAQAAPELPVGNGAVEASLDLGVPSALPGEADGTGTGGVPPLRPPSREQPDPGLKVAHSYCFGSGAYKY